MRNLPRFRPKLQPGSRRRKTPRNRQCLGEMRIFLINRPKDQRINNCMETTTLMDSAVPSRWRKKGGIEETGQERTSGDKRGRKRDKGDKSRDETGRNGTEKGQRGPAVPSSRRGVETGTQLGLARWGDVWQAFER